MKTKLLYSTLLSIILLFVGCMKDDNMQLRSGPEATLLLNVPTRTVGSGEDEIKEVRVVSFVPEDAGNAAGWMEVNGGVRPLESSTITQTLRTGIRDVYVFANETAVEGLSAQLDGMRNLTDLKAIQVPYSGTLTPPFLCSYVQPKFSIEKEGSVSMEAKVVRAVSKVALTLNYKWGEGTDMLPEEIVIETVQVKQLPKYSYLVGKPYDGDNLVNSDVLEGAALADQSTQPTKEYKSNELVLYIPEFLGATAAQDKHAFIEIIGSLKSNSSIKCKYKIPLGDDMTPTTITNYNITRNTKFEIAAEIKSFGEMDNMFVMVKVLPWNTVNQDEQTGRYVAFSKITDGADATIADGSNLNDMGTTLKVTCNTNIGGWYTVTRDVKGDIVHKSSPTTSVSAAASQTVNITIPKLTEESQDYTVSIYHPTIAMESVGPVKSLSFTQWGGFIPNSVLTAAGWPADKLPKTGLQLAKRGNQKLPSGVAEEYDPERQWKTTNTPTAGVETANNSADSKLGMGKSSTDAMVATPALAAEHPAANYCREMGPDWYLPSLAELALIYNNKSTFGASYTFGATAHWSATQSNTSGSWYVNFNGGNTGYSSLKTSNLRVRCVREI